MDNMKIVACDIETDNLNPKHIYVVCAKDLETGKLYKFINLDKDVSEKVRFNDFAASVRTWVFHNGLGFDVPVINKFMGSGTIKPCDVVDTLVVSRLIDYNILNGHSLKAWGIRLGLHKGEFTDFAGGLSEEMIEYCFNDVEVTAKVYNKFKSQIEDPQWKLAMRTEHDIAATCEEMTGIGFKFDRSTAQEMLSEMEVRMSDLEQEFQKIWPPKLVEVNRLKYREKTDGTLFGTVKNALAKYPKCERQGEELVCFDYKTFEPSSPKQRIERLWEAGWEPVEKTKGHMEYERQR